VKAGGACQVVVLVAFAVPSSPSPPPPHPTGGMQQALSQRTDCGSGGGCAARATGGMGNATGIVAADGLSVEEGVALRL